MRVLSFTRALSLSLLLTSSVCTSAATIFSQDFDPLLTETAGSSDFSSNNQRATSFSFSGGDQTLGSISWLGFYPLTPSPSTDDFTIRIFADNGSGQPESLASILDFNIPSSVNRTNTGTDLFSFDLYSYQADLSTGVNLTSDATYWLSIINNVGTSASDDWRWGVSSLATANSSLHRAFDGDTWNQNSATLQFELSTAPAAVPVPAAIWLMLSGIAGLAALKRKKQA